jgi:hypothetical protein
MTARRPATLSTRFERATASVSATAFIANRSRDRSMTAAAISVFLPARHQALENLDFHGLATEQAFQFPHPSLKFTGKQIA